MRTRRLLAGLFSLLFVATISQSARAQEPTADPPPPTTTPDTKKDDTWQNPAKGADPPLLPKTSPSSPPTSTSGTDVAPSDPPGPAPVIMSSGGSKETDDRQDARLRQLENRVARDEHEMHRLEDRLRFLKNLTISGYIQPQLLVQTFNTHASPNLQANGQLPPGIGPNDTIANTDGTTTNRTFFRVRRARLRTIYETDVMRFYLQLDAFPVGGVGPGIGTILRNAEATGIARWNRDIRTELTAGLFLTPFRAELLELSMTRPFIERTWFVQNVFPLERNYGLHAKTFAMDDHLVLDLSVVNGQTLGEKEFVALPDLNRSKDLIGYLQYRIGFVTLGTSGYIGKGQIVDTSSLRFKQYDKWAVNYEAAARYRLLRRVGETRLSAELTVAQNMDAGVNYAFGVPAIPLTLTDGVANLDERAFYVRFEQDLGRHVTMGYRFDTYTPNTAIKNNGRDTHALLAMWKFNQNLRFMNELDWAIDNAHAFGTSPPSKHIVAYSGVLQATF